MDQPSTPKAERKPRRYAASRRNPPVAPSINGNGWLIQRSILTICPWAADTFRGRRRTFLSELPGALTWSAVQNWRSGRRQLPPDVALALAALHRERAAAERELSDDLEHYAKMELAKPKRLTGFMAQRVPGPR